MIRAGSVARMHPSDISSPHKNWDAHRSPSKGWWILLAILTVPVFMVVALLISNEMLFFADLWWNEHVIVTEGTFWYHIALLCHILGKTAPLCVAAFLIASVCLFRGHYRSALFTIVAMAMSILGMRALKVLITRERPWHDLIEQGGYAFPSGHSMVTATLVSVIVYLIAVHRSHQLRSRRLAFCIAVMATVVMMWSRTALQVHWLSDTIGGSLLGVAIAVLCARLFLRTPTERVWITPPLPRKVV